MQLLLYLAIYSSNKSFLLQGEKTHNNICVDKSFCETLLQLKDFLRFLPLFSTMPNLV